MAIEHFFTTFPDMQNGRIKDIIILLLKLVAIEESLSFIAANYFFEIKPSAITPAFVISILALFVLNWKTNKFQNKNYLKPTGIILVFILLFFAVHFRAGIFWALNTFPLRDANIVLLTLQEPFDDFAYAMIRFYLITTIPQALIIALILTAFLYIFLSSTKKRSIFIGAYVAATIALFISDIPISDYVHILNDEPEKNASYSEFFVKNYVNPDSVKITAPEQKRNLILIYLESLETTFADKEHGGYQEENLIPEITELALKNISFGKFDQHIGGGLDAYGSGGTYATMITRSLGIPLAAHYPSTPILHHYKSIYNILNENGYKQVYFQGNPGMYNQFHNFVKERSVDEVYGPDDLFLRLNINIPDLQKKHGGKSVPDKDAFDFAIQILDTITEPFSLTFFSIDTHSPYGIYDPDCVKASNEKSEEGLLKASIHCISRELDKFLSSIKTKSFYSRTSIIIFGDHLFMGKHLVENFNNRKWINIFINPSKQPTSEYKRFFSDIDMFPTILSSINFDIKGNRLGLGTDLFSGQKTLIESIGIDSLNKEIGLLGKHLMYESYLLKKHN